MFLRRREWVIVLNFVEELRKMKIEYWLLDLVVWMLSMIFMGEVFERWDEYSVGIGLKGNRMGSSENGCFFIVFLGSFGEERG